MCWQVAGNPCAGEEQQWTCPSEGPSKASATLATGVAPKAMLSTAVRTQAVLLSLAAGTSGTLQDRSRPACSRIFRSVVNIFYSVNPLFK